MIQTLNSTLRRVPAWPLYIVGLAPLLWLVWLLSTGGLGVDPVKALEQNLGDTGLKLIIAGLAVTPLRKYAGLNLIKFRRALGLLAFLYVTLHLTVWLVLDIQLRWGEIWTDITKRPYITIGMAGFAMLLPLAITSNNYSVRKLGAATWRKLHWLTYPAALAGAIHYVMVVKGWQITPMIYFAVVAQLLLMRVKLSRGRMLARFAPDSR